MSLAFCRVGLQRTIGQGKTALYPLANICLIPRSAWRVRSSFSINEKRVWASPWSPKPMWGATGESGLLAGGYGGYLLGEVSPSMVHVPVFRDQALISTRVKSEEYLEWKHVDG